VATFSNEHPIEAILSIAHLATQPFALSQSMRHRFEFQHIHHQMQIHPQDQQCGARPRSCARYENAVSLEQMDIQYLLSKWLRRLFVDAIVCARGVLIKKHVYLLFIYIKIYTNNSSSDECQKLPKNAAKGMRRWVRNNGHASRPRHPMGS
jgi:hypothetical protein